MEHTLKDGSDGENHGGGTEHDGNHHGELVDDVEEADLGVYDDRVLGVCEEVDDVGDSVGSPASRLVEELIEVFRCVRQRVRRCAV